MTPRVATFLIFVVNGAVVGTWLASVPGIKTKLGASGTEIGIVLFVAAIGALVSQQITGQLLVRYPSRQVLVVTSLVLPLLVVPPLLAPSIAALALVMLVFGAFNTAMDLSMNHHGVALEEAGGRSIFSGLHAGWSIGGIIGAVGVGVALSIGIDRLTEVLVAGLSLLVVALIALRSVGTGAQRTEGASGISWPSREVLPLALLIVCVALVEGGLSDWGGVYLRNGVGASAEVAAFAYAALAVGLTVGRLVGDRVKDRIGSVRLIQGGTLVSALAIAVMVLVGDATVALAALVLAGAGIANAVPQLFGAAGRIRPHGPSLSAAFTFLTIAFLVGPPVIGVTTDTFGVSIALGLLVVASMVVVVSVRRVPSAETNPTFRRGMPSATPPRIHPSA